MALKKRKWWNIVGLFSDWFRDSVTEAIPAEQRLESDAREMMAGLEEMSNTVSLAMALADQKRDELTKLVRDRKALETQAKHLIASGDEARAQQCVTLKIHLTEEIKRVAEDYKVAQHSAEEKLVRFRSEETKAKQRLLQLPRLKQDAKMIRQREKIEQTFSSLQLNSPTSSFDELAGELDLKKRQLDNRQQLSQGPAKDLGADVAMQLQAGKVEEEMKRLRLEAGNVEVAEFEVIDDTVEEAEKLLGLSRFDGSFSSKVAELGKEDPSETMSAD